MEAVRFLVSGRVQGVSFRAWTRQQALELGLRGHARNLGDGRVEVLAAGAIAAIETLSARLQHGPPHARVESVARAVAAVPDRDGFNIA